MSDSPGPNRANPGPQLARDDTDLQVLTYFLESSSFSGESSGQLTSQQGGAGGGGGGNNPPPPVGDHCHNYEMELNSVSFGGEGFSRVYHDLVPDGQTEQQPFPSPQWVDTTPRDNKNDATANTTDLYPNLGLGYPVSYARNSELVATVNYNIIYIPPEPFG